MGYRVDQGGHSAPVSVDRVFYTKSYDLAFEALVDTLQRFQHIVTRISMFWLKFQGDPETDEYRYQQSKYFDKVVTTLWSAIEVAELTERTAQKVPLRDPKRKPGKGGRGKGDRGGKGKPREKKNQPCWHYTNGKCKYMGMTASSSMWSQRPRGHLSGRCYWTSWWTTRLR